MVLHASIKFNKEKNMNQEKEAEKNRENELWNQKQLSQVLGISHKTAESWRSKGEGPPYIKLSARCVRYLAKDVFKYLEHQKVATANPNNDRQ
jgi:predicted DNA-binding transcriptional regulator AlpA